MATIRKRNGRYQVQIGKDQHSLVTKTFSRLTDAKRWASTTEYEIEVGLFKPSPAPDFLSVGDLIGHYLLINNKQNLSGFEIYYRLSWH